MECYTCMLLDHKLLVLPNQCLFKEHLQGNTYRIRFLSWYIQLQLFQTHNFKMAAQWRAFPTMHHQRFCSLIGCQTCVRQWQQTALIRGNCQLHLNWHTISWGPPISVHAHYLLSSHCDVPALSDKGGWWGRCVEILTCISDKSIIDQLSN